MSTYYAIDFPNLSNSKYAPDEGLFDNSFPQDHIDACIKAFKEKFEHQPSFFISKESWSEILNPLAKFPGLVPPHLEKLYAIAFCYCISEAAIEPYVYLRIRLLFSNPPSSPQIEKAHTLVYTVPFGRTQRVSSGDSFSWFTSTSRVSGSNAVELVGQDVERWAHDVHDVKFPETIHLCKNGKVMFYEGNIVGKRRLQEIYENEVVGKNKKGITIDFAYDDETKKIFLVFNVNPTYTTNGMDDPLRCPPREIHVCQNSA